MKYEPANPSAEKLIPVSILGACRSSKTEPANGGLSRSPLSEVLICQINLLGELHEGILMLEDRLRIVLIKKPPSPTDDTAIGVPTQLIDIIEANNVSLETAIAHIRDIVERLEL